MFYVCCMGIINMYKYIICALISSNAPCRDAMMTNDGWEEAKLSKLCRYEQQQPADRHNVITAQRWRID